MGFVPNGRGQRRAPCTAVSIYTIFKSAARVCAVFTRPYKSKEEVTAA